MVRGVDGSLWICLRSIPDDVDEMEISDHFLCGFDQTVRLLLHHVLRDATVRLAVHLESHCEADQDHQEFIDEADRDSDGFDPVSFGASLLRLICALFL